jgi:hypothetical protein
VLRGGAGDDKFDAGAGDDVIYGGNGDDRIYSGSGADYIEGGVGADRFLYPNPDETTFVFDGQTGVTAGDQISDFTSGVDGFEYFNSNFEFGSFSGTSTEGENFFTTPGYDGTNSGAAAGAAHFIFDSVSQTLYFDTDSATDGYQTVASVQSGGSVAAGDIEIINPGPLWKIQAALTPYGVPGAADPFSEGAGAAAHRPGAGQNVQPVKAAGLENNCRRRSDPKAHPLKRRPGPGHMNGMGDEINCLDSCLV